MKKCVKEIKYEEVEASAKSSSCSQRFSEIELNHLELP